MPWNEVPGKFRAGTLHSGSPSGPRVTSRAQATAIMLSEKRAAMHGKNEYAAAAQSSRPMHPKMIQRAQMVHEAHQHMTATIPEYKTASPRQRMLMTQEHIRTRLGK